jgi:uncharacterized membrane protein YbhN (UPF0104 family)
MAMRRLAKWLEALMDRQPAPETSVVLRTWRAAGAGILFIGVVAWAWSSWEEKLDDVRLAPTMALLFIGIPLGIGFVAWEQLLAFDLAGQNQGWLRSVRVALAASAANLLPLPGSLIVRTAALKQSGSTFKRSLGVTSLLGVLWIGVTITLVGAVALTASVGVGGALCVVGLLVSSAVLRVLNQRLEPSRTLLLGCLLVAVAKVLVAALNVWLAFRALGAEIDLVGSVIISSSAVLATAAGFFPGGLGLRELLSSFLAQAAGYDSAIAVLATALERLAWIIGLATAWLLLNALVAGPFLRGETPGSEQTSQLPAIDSRPPETNRRDD